MTAAEREWDDLAGVFDHPPTQGGQAIGTSSTTPSPIRGLSGEPGILDTSILIATDVTPIPGELAISVASLAELQFGVLIAKTAEARALRWRG